MISQFPGKSPSAEQAEGLASTPAILGVAGTPKQQGEQ